MKDVAIKLHTGEADRRISEVIEENINHSAAKYTSGHHFAYLLRSIPITRQCICVMDKFTHHWETGARFEQPLHVQMHTKTWCKSFQNYLQSSPNPNRHPYPNRKHNQRHNPFCTSNQPFVKKSIKKLTPWPNTMYLISCLMPLSKRLFNTMMGSSH